MLEFAATAGENKIVAENMHPGQYLNFKVVEKSGVQPNRTINELMDDLVQRKKEEDEILKPAEINGYSLMEFF